MSKHLTYSNVMATVAVFIALGGSSYAAAKLARNSVGAKQVRAHAIGASELRTGAVSSRDVRNESILLRDLSRSVQDGLRGPAGPIGPPGPATAPYFSAVSATGDRLAGNAARASYNGGEKLYRVGFDRSLDGCAATVTVANSAPEGSLDNGGAYATVGRQENEIVVRTYAADGTPKSLPFNLLLAC